MCSGRVSPSEYVYNEASTPEATQRLCATGAGGVTTAKTCVCAAKQPCVYAAELRPSHQFSEELSPRTLLLCSSAEYSSSRRQRSWHRHGHNDHVRATEVTSNDPSSSKVHRCEGRLTSSHKELAIFTLYLCPTAECYFLDAAASRRRRHWSKQRPEHHD
jgi:hypothetical protein